MSGSRVFLLFAFMGGMVLLAEGSINGTRRPLIGANPSTWGPPLASSGTATITREGLVRLMLVAIMSVFVFFLLLQ